MKLSWEDRSAKVLASMENGKWHLRCMEGVNDQNDMYYGYVGIVCIHIRLPVVPHKAVAEVSRIGNV